MPPLPPLKSANGVDLPFIRLCTRMWSRPIGGVHAAACDARELELTLILEVQLYSRTLTCVIPPVCLHPWVCVVI